MFPLKIMNLINDLRIEEITDCHRSGDIVYSIENIYILKISSQIKRLEEEFKRDEWIHKYIPSPKPIMFIVKNQKAFYLREYIDGENLCSKRYVENPKLLINLLVEAINIIHSVKVEDKKFIDDNEYNTLTHGDFCLPNILVENDKFKAFIDLGDAGIGDPWRDYAWCIWSLEYNLNTNKYTPLLLEKLGIKFNQEKYDKYIN